MAVSPSTRRGNHVAPMLLLLLLCLRTASANSSVTVATSAIPGAAARATASNLGPGEPLSVVSVAPRSGAALDVSRVVPNRYHMADVQ